METKNDSILYVISLMSHRLKQIPKSEHERREKTLISLFEFVLKYLAYILVAQIRSDGNISDKAMNEIAKLSRPSLGMYSGLVRIILKIYKNIKNPFTDKIICFLNEKLDESTLTDMQKLAYSTEFKIPKNANTYVDLFDVLVKYRNAWAHELFNTDISKEHRLSSLSNVIKAILERFEFISRMQVVEVVSAETNPDVKSRGCYLYKMRSWSGNLINEPTEIELKEILEDGNVYLVVQSDNEAIKYLDLTPFCVVFNDKQDQNLPKLYMFNGLQKTKLDYFCFDSSLNYTVTIEHNEYLRLNSMITDLIASEQQGGIPPYLTELLKVSPESEHFFRNAEVELSEGEIDNAIRFLGFAISESPGYREAILQRCRLWEHQSKFDQAHEDLVDYLELVPNDIEILLEDAKYLLLADCKEEAKNRLNGVLALKPDNMEAKMLMADVESGSIGSLSKLAKEKEKLQILLPYEIITSILFDHPHNAKFLLLIVISIFTLFEFCLFYIYKDFIMAMTMISTGVLWIAIILSTFHIRKLLSDSRTNFSAFIKAKEGQDFRHLFGSMMIKIFGALPSPDILINNNLKLLHHKILDRTTLSQELDHDYSEATISIWCKGRYFIKVLKANIKSILLQFGLSLIIILAIYNVKMYSPNYPVVNYSFMAYVFFLALSFSYLALVIFSFQGMLLDLRFQQIHFSLVQHPKLSIRYLSFLSRKLTDPLLIVYFLATLTLFLGPFNSNLLFIGILTLFALVCIGIYYISIFMVRSVIIKNKWRLISQFSSHFDLPFNRLISQGKIEDLNQIRELEKIRDFIESMNVWAEKKGKLFSTMIMYIIAVFFILIGLSHIMPGLVVPMLYQGDINRITNDTLMTLNSSDSYFPNSLEFSDNSMTKPVIKVAVSGVDDVFLVIWGRNISDLTTMVDSIKSNGLLPDYELSETESRFSGYKRCDWSNANHGKFVKYISLDDSLHLLIYGYNKEYSFKYRIFNLPIFGGGKYSHNLLIEYGALEEDKFVSAQEIFRDTRFVRMNSKEHGFSMCLEVKVKNGNEKEVYIRNESWMKKNEYLVKTLAELDSIFYQEPSVVGG